LRYCLSSKADNQAILSEHDVSLQDATMKATSRVCCEPRSGERYDNPRETRERRLSALGDVAIKEGTLVQVLLPAEGELGSQRRSIKELPFYGMWSDRDDIIDGVTYVNALRNNPRG
jgi:hypothetical protein